jgi:hypothetical protein
VVRHRIGTAHLELDPEAARAVLALEQDVRAGAKAECALKVDGEHTHFRSGKPPARTPSDKLLLQEPREGHGRKALDRG